MTQTLSVPRRTVFLEQAAVHGSRPISLAVCSPGVCECVIELITVMTTILIVLILISDVCDKWEQSTKAEACNLHVQSN